MMIGESTMEAWGEESGAAATEYAVVVALIAMAVVLTVGLLGHAVNGLFDSGAIEAINESTP
jgi:Flp pilus assembly pilin Flp